MTDFDFAAAEREMQTPAEGPTLRERALEAWTDLETDLTRELLIAAHEAIDDILGESNATDVTVEVKVRPGEGVVTMTIDNMRFKLTREIATSGDDEFKHTLALRTNGSSWRNIRHLADLGRALEQVGPCYAVRPENDGRGTQ